MRRALIAILACVFLSSLCLICAAQDKVMLVHRVTKGQVTRSNLEAGLKVVVKSTNRNMVSTTIETDTVKSISPSGDITTESIMGATSTTINGEKQPNEPAIGDATTSVVHANGSLVSNSGDTKDTFTRTMVNCMHCVANIVFGSKPVGVGDTWTAHIKPEQIADIVPATVVYKVIASGLKQGVDCYEIQGSFHETGGVKPATASSTVWIDKKTGDAVSVDLTVNNYAMAGADSVVIHIKMSKILEADSSAPKPK